MNQRALRRFSFGPFALLAGILFYFIGGDFNEIGNAALQWHEVQGQIQKVGVERELNIGRGAKFDRYDYKPTVEFRFSVEGAEYVGTKLSLPKGISFDDKEEAEAFGQKLLSDPVRTIYFDPNDPTQSTLFRGGFNEGDNVKQLGIGLAILGALLTLIVFPAFIYGALLSSKDRRRKG